MCRNYLDYRIGPMGHPKSSDSVLLLEGDYVVSAFFATAPGAPAVSSFSIS